MTDGGFDPTRTGCGHPDEAVLDDFVDGVIPDGGRRAVEVHLEDCPACRRQVDELRELIARAAGLPGIAPRRNLWPAIASAATRPRGSRAAWVTLAASLLLVAAVSGAWWIRGGRTDRSSEPAPPSGAAVPAELLEAERAFAEAGDRLLATLEERRTDLPPETREAFRHNLELLDRAIGQARAALENEPSDPESGLRLTALHRKRMQLLWRTARLSS